MREPRGGPDWKSRHKPKVDAPKRRMWYLLHCGDMMPPMTSGVLTLYCLVPAFLMAVCQLLSTYVFFLMGAMAPLPPSPCTSVSLVLSFEAAIISGQTLT